MTDAIGKPLTGRKVLLIVCSAFAVIITVNLTLAYKAVATFPGLEVKNSYVASQHFNADRAAQEALDWNVAAKLESGELRLSFDHAGTPVAPRILKATLGRATNVSQDQSPVFEWDGAAYVADVALGSGNWNLRLEAEAEDGTMFRQRVIVRVIK